MDHGSTDDGKAHEDVHSFKAQKVVYSLSVFVLHQLLPTSFSISSASSLEPSPSHTLHLIAPSCSPVATQSPFTELRSSKRWQTKVHCFYICVDTQNRIQASLLLIAEKMEPVQNGEEPTSWEDLYRVNLIPSELFLKFRKEIEGLRVGVNLEIYNAPINELQAKLVLKPLSPDRRWKFMYEPIRQDVRIISKKIPVTKYLNLQVGIAHNFQLNATGWKWKVTTCFGGDGISRIRNKTTLGLCPGMDMRFGWRADFVLPEVTGELGTGEPLFNMSTGKLEASLDRVEAIMTHTS